MLLVVMTIVGCYQKGNASEVAHELGYHDGKAALGQARIKIGPGRGPGRIPAGGGGGGPPKLGV